MGAAAIRAANLGGASTQAPSLFANARPEGG